MLHIFLKTHIKKTTKEENEDGKVPIIEKYTLDFLPVNLYFC